MLTLKGARGNNSRNVDLEIPIGLLTCVTGVSGSGKSTLINNTLFPLSATALNGATTLEAAAHDSIKGLEHLDKVVDHRPEPDWPHPAFEPGDLYRAVHTNPRTVRRRAGVPSRVATAQGVSRSTSRAGAAKPARAMASIKVEMHFLPDIYVPCVCAQEQALQSRDPGDQIQGQEHPRNPRDDHRGGPVFFDAVPALARKLQTLMDVGLSYIKLGQSATRCPAVKPSGSSCPASCPSATPARPCISSTEPTTGLHFADIQQLLDALHRLRDHGNTVVVIEHNLDVIKHR